MIYLVIANIAIAFSFSLYHLFFRKLTFFQWNRFYLLGAVLVSLLVPVGLFIDLSAYFVEEIPTIHLAEMIDMPVIQFSATTVPYRLMDVLGPVYWVGVLLSLGYLLYRLLQLHKLFSREEDYLSFSFFRKIFLGQKVRQHEAILTHEQVHVQQRHSYDIVFMELVKAFNWFNPALYFMLKELKFQHECIADEACSADKVAYAELLVAHAMKVEPDMLAHGFSNHSFLKKRIMMLFKNKSSQKHKLFYLSVLPFLLIVAGSTLLFNTSKAKEIVSTVENRIQDVALPIKKEAVSGSVALEKHLVEAEHVSTPIQIVTEDPKASLGFMQDTTRKGGRISLKGSSQPHIDQDINRIFESVEVNPSPKRGMDVFRKWIAENYQYPQAAINAGVKGTITVGFIVEADGSLSDIKTLKDIGHGTGEAAVKLMEKAEPWNPGVQNGRAVRVSYTLPIRLDLTQIGYKTYRATPDIGYERLREWLSASFKLPRKLTSNDVDPYMYVSFDVDENGGLSNFRTKSDLEASFTNQLVTLLKNTKWNPEEENGVKQKSKGSIWVKFDRNGKFIRDYTRVELWPSPKNGMDDFRRNIADNLKYPTEMIEKKESGKVEVHFEIKPDGSPGNFKILEEPYKGVGNNVIELIQKYGRWNPGIIDGRPILARYSLAANMKMNLGYGVIILDGLKVELDKSVLK